ncbi:hypothetical protein GCM10010289_12950 [Streptomyces violascens]|uniref:ARG and Rhodanese-Phosphatase-superfamily-associated domain-containing protein n=1 Tax=Streptomyces violascens TaxID=67381 RepID=A0ABQ3QK58_9ACTN|nr:hypothetical protein GCM10010289_12950 [Streptomyces violascens]GHI37655.1 hypothetical protein Sviol_20630 [Streptomyces violascens]
MPSLDLTGLTAGPAQVWGGIRLVPLLRAEAVEGLRLSREAYGDPAGAEVRLNDTTRYTSYVPHGFVADWSGEGPSAAYGTRLGDGVPNRVPLHRMAKRRPGDRLRFLPLHLALEGYLALHFGGPSVQRDTWSRAALRSGLSPRVESAYLGARCPGSPTRCGCSRSTRASAVSSCTRRTRSAPPSRCRTRTTTGRCTPPCSRTCSAS